ncbi:MAG: DEAD/DEAH box helicase, partial [Candidatus Polarisedimenticolia bacterium]
AAVEAARRAGAKPPRIVRFRPRPADRETLRAAGIEIAQRMSDVALLPGQGVVVGMTTHGAAALADECFDRVFLDEAAQVTVAHALPALRRAPRGALFGDDAQLGPVLAAEHDDGPAARSIFALLRGAAPATMLDETYRLNDDLCAFPSRVFYDGRLRPAPGVGARRLALRAAGDVVDQVLDPERGAVFVAVDHVGRRHWSPEEAEAAATIAAALIERAGLAADQLAVVAPFRRQNAAIERLLRRRLGKGAPLPVVDTIERIQGQEREAVVLSLACSDPEALRARTDFFFSPLRLNVALTRARTKLVVLGSPRLLRLIPPDLAGLRRIDIFHRLFAELPTIAWPAANAPASAPRKAPRSEKRRR